MTLPPFNATLLVIDDEVQIRRLLRVTLEGEGYKVRETETGQLGLQEVAHAAPDGIILDLGLPDLDGKEVIVRVREWSDSPIIVLSARDVEGEKIAALDAGADDYVNKPVGVGELLARLRAALRGRDRRFASQARFRTGELAIDFALRRVTLEDQEVHLTPREYDLLRVLARHAGRVVTHRQVIAAVWGAGAQVDAQFVRVLVGQLRQKLEAEPSTPRLVTTEPGLGYRLTAEDEPPPAG